MNERKKKRKVGKECNLIHDNIFVCLFVVVVVVAVADKFLFLFFTTATDILI